MKYPLFLTLICFWATNLQAQSTFEITGPESICSGASATLTANNCTGTIQWSTGATTTSITVSPGFNTSYSATCTENANVTQIYKGIAVIPTPKIDTTFNSVCQNVTLTLENAPSSSNVVWKKDGVIIPNNSSLSYISNDAGVYTAEIEIAGGWASQSGEFTHNTLNDVTFFANTLGFTVGNNGVILKSTNNGDNWEQLNSNTVSHLYKIFIHSATIAWVVGANGTIIKTSDGGVTWQKQRTATNRDIVNILFINSTTGWLLAGNNIFYTNNGGTSWTLQLTHTSSLWGIAALNPSSIWVVGNNGSVLHSTNGISWGSVNVNSTSHLYDISFVDSSNGWIVGNNNTIRRTTNAGTTWATQTSGAESSTAIVEVQFIDSSTGWFKTAWGNFYRTTNAGVSWTSPLSRIKGQALAFHMFDTNNGIMVGDFAVIGNEVGSVQLNSQIARTTNGANNWATIHTGLMKENYFTDIYFTDIQNGYATTYAQCYKTINGGKQWQSIPSLSIEAYDYRDIFFTNSTHGWIVGRRFSFPAGLAIIMATTDGGQTWTQQNTSLASNIILYKAYFINTTTGWIVGSNGTIIKTTNGGGSWVQKNSGITRSLRDVQFIDENRGWASGNNGVLLTTSDGGETWSSLNTSITSTIRALHFSNANVGWFVAASVDDGLYKTTNGGTTWIKQDIDMLNNNFITTVQFIDSNNGWVLANNNAFSTNNGGASWKKSPHFSNPTNMFFRDNANGWICGSSILKFQPISTPCSSVPMNIPAFTGTGLQQTVKSGNWHDATVWSCGQVPVATQNVLIKSPHRIEVLPAQTAKCKNIATELGAILNIPAGASLEASAWR
jgi:photosystem II stability/assembly factor-like uncharacterized protein